MLGICSFEIIIISIFMHIMKKIKQICSRIRQMNEAFFPSIIRSIIFSLRTSQIKHIFIPSPLNFSFIAGVRRHNPSYYKYSNKLPQYNTDTHTFSEGNRMYLHTNTAHVFLRLSSVRKCIIPKLAFFIWEWWSNIHHMRVKKTLSHRMLIMIM